jgi:hypothetical protein
MSQSAPITDGEDGTSCSSVRLRNSVQIKCGNRITYVYDGDDGHSVVTQTQPASTRECLTSGTRLDLYMDRDDSLSVTRSDSYLSSVITCNGLNGLQGVAGPIGPQGLTGSVGATGTTGAVGPQGLTGTAGPVGPQGPIGPQGIQGPSGTNSGATITNYGSNSCTRITGTNSYVKPTGSNNIGLYTTSNCASNSKFAEVSQGEAYWVSSTSLGTWVDGCLRVITFN